MIRLFTLSLSVCLILQIPVSAFAQPANDECSGAITFATTPFGASCSSSVSANTSGATQSAPPITCTGNQNDDDIWYSFTAPTRSVVLRFSNTVNNGTGANATIGFALYQGPCPGSASELICNNLGSAGAGFQIISDLRPGLTYYLRFWSTLTGTNTASFDFCVQEAVSPPNDECADAIEVATQPVGTDCNSGTSATTIGAGASTPVLDCPNDYADDDIWYSFVANTSAIRIHFSNAKLATSVSGNGNLGYAIYDAPCGGGVPISCGENIGNGRGDELVGGLVPGNRYFLRFFSYAFNRYINFDFCLVDVDLPLNDECVNALELTVSISFCTNPLLTSLSNATTSPGFGAPDCAGLSGSEDVWYKVILPPSGNLVVQTSMADYDIIDLVMEAWAGDCGSLSLIACDDNSNPEPGIGTLHPRIELAGRTPGETIYIRMLGKGGINFGPFTICAWDASVIANVAGGGDCVDGQTVTISAANGNHYMWVPVLDAAGDVIAEINANGHELGTVNTSLFVSTTGTLRTATGANYLDRNIAIETAAQASTRLRIYFKSDEFEALRLAHPTLTGQQLRIHKDEDPCRAGLPASPQLIEPEQAGNYGDDYFIELETPGFSSFYITDLVDPLPVELISFEASCENDGVKLRWSTATEINNKYFELEKSSDGIDYQTIAQIPGAGNTSTITNYEYTDQTFNSNQALYRLKQTDIDGRFEYSNVVRLSCATDAGLRVFPNPFTNNLEIDLNGRFEKGQLLILDALGRQRIIQSFSASSSRISIQASALEPGIYFLKIWDVKTGEYLQKKLVKRGD